MLVKHVEKKQKEEEKFLAMETFKKMVMDMFLHFTATGGRPRLEPYPRLRHDGICNGLRSVSGNPGDDQKRNRQMALGDILRRLQHGSGVHRRGSDLSDRFNILNKEELWSTSSSD